MLKSIKKFTFITLASIIFPLQAKTATATPDDDPTLEVIEVTSRKRVENLQKVPISVNTLSNEQLHRRAIDRIDDLSAYIPNLSMTETGLSTQVFIRGVGTGNNQGFEQSVVQFIDGVSYARQQLTRAPLFDMARAEVLRGPQSILFGKNAIAGALNLTTADVEEYFSSALSTQLGEYGLREYQGIINAPLIENTLYGRLSVRSYKEAGFIRNTFLNTDNTAQDDFTVRGQLKYLLSDAITAKLKIEHNTFDAQGRNTEVLQDNGEPGLAFGTTLGGGFGLTQAITETRLNYERQADTDDQSQNDSTAYVMNIAIDNDQYQITSTTAYLTYDFNEVCDCDFIGAPIFTVPTTESYDQWSQEFRVEVQNNEQFNWQAGVFVQTADIDFTDAISIPRGDVGQPGLSVLPSAVAALTDNMALGQSISGTSVRRNFTQDSTHISTFIQGDWQMTARLQLSLGARWSYEDKSGARDIVITDTATGAATINPLAPVVLDNLFAIASEQTSGHNLTGNRRERTIDPSVVLQYQLFDETMLYGSWSKGSKSGGFDTRANVTSSFEFADESATAYEIGAKTTFWQQRAQLNIAYYHTDYNDLQVSQFDGTLGFVVGNADAEVSGIEVDGRVAITDNLQANYAFSYLDHEFTDHRQGNCYYRQEFDTTHPGRAARFNPETGLCDYTGLSGQYTPDYTANLALDYYMPFAGEQLRFTVNYHYVDEQNVHQNLDPDFIMSAYQKVDINLAFEAENWSLALLGRNIFDEKIITYAGNTPLSGTFGADTVYGFIAPPATWSVQFDYLFE